MQSAMKSETETDSCQHWCSANGARIVQDVDQFLGCWFSLGGDFLPSELDSELACTSNGNQQNGVMTQQKVRGNN